MNINKKIIFGSFLIASINLTLVCLNPFGGMKKIPKYLYEKADITRDFFLTSTVPKMPELFWLTIPGYNDAVLIQLTVLGHAEPTINPDTKKTNFSFVDPTLFHESTLNFHHLPTGLFIWRSNYLHHQQLSNQFNPSVIGNNKNIFIAKATPTSQYGFAYAFSGPHSKKYVNAYPLAHEEVWDPKNAAIDASAILANQVKPIASEESKSWSNWFRSWWRTKKTKTENEPPKQGQFIIAPETLQQLTQEQMPTVPQIVQPQVQQTLQTPQIPGQEIVHQVLPQNPQVINPVQLPQSSTCGPAATAPEPSQFMQNQIPVQPTLQQPIIQPQIIQQQQPVIQQPQIVQSQLPQEQTKLCALSGCPNPCYPGYQYCSRTHGQQAQRQMQQQINPAQQIGTNRIGNIEFEYDTNTGFFYFYDKNQQTKTDAQNKGIFLHYSFKNEWMSNTFYRPNLVHWHNDYFGSSEALFQLGKDPHNQQYKNALMHAHSGGQAARIAKQYFPQGTKPTNANWFLVFHNGVEGRVMWMYQTVKAKFAQNADLAQALIAALNQAKVNFGSNIGSPTIQNLSTMTWSPFIEDSPYDDFWGMGSAKAGSAQKNMLGKILWIIAEELSNGTLKIDQNYRPYFKPLLSHNASQQTIQQSAIPGKQTIQTSLMIQPTMLWQAIKENDQANRTLYTRDQLKNLFAQQIDAILQTNKNINILPPKHNHILRILTYNVYGFKNAYGNHTISDTLNVLQNIDADVAILQEVIDNPAIRQDFKSLGYTNISFAGYTKHSNFGNMIASKFDFAQAPKKHTFGPASKKHNRSFIKVELNLSQFGKKNLVVYGTHFEVSDRNQRLEEARELVARSSQQDSNKNVLIAADFNESKQGKALHYLAQNGFITVFDKAHIQEPYFSHWAGNVLDNIYLNKNSWDLPIIGAYLYYSKASDHMPVIADFAI